MYKLNCEHQENPSMQPSFKVVVPNNGHIRKVSPFLPSLRLAILWAIAHLPKEYHSGPNYWCIWDGTDVPIPYDNPEISSYMQDCHRIGSLAG